MVFPPPPPSERAKDGRQEITRGHNTIQTSTSLRYSGAIHHGWLADRPRKKI